MRKDTVIIAIVAATLLLAYLIWKQIAQWNQLVIQYKGTLDGAIAYVKKQAAADAMSGGLNTP